MKKKAPLWLTIIYLFSLPFQVASNAYLEKYFENMFLLPFTLVALFIILITYPIGKAYDRYR